MADRTADNKVAAALLAYACQLEQRARLIESAKKKVGVDIIRRAIQVPARQITAVTMLYSTNPSHRLVVNPIAGMDIA